MVSMRLALLCVVAMGCMTAFAGESKKVVTLEELRDHKRVLLIFAASRDDARFKAQVATMQSHVADAEERDLMVIEAPLRGESSGAIQLADTDSVRRRFRVGREEFVVLLVGKDGGEKLRSEQPIEFERLRTTIDAMPMRQDEMRKKQ
jgi:hypothetical protein